MRAIFGLIFSYCALLGLTAEGRTATYFVNVFETPGVPGTGGPLPGPCHCPGAGYKSPLYLLNPGDTVDFGYIVPYPILAPDFHQSVPPGAPLTLTFVQAMPGVSFDSTISPMYGQYVVKSWLSNQPSRTGEFNLTPIHLLYTLPANAMTIQIAFIGSYTAPPELAPTETPIPGALMLFFPVAVGMLAWFRSNKVRHVSAN